MLLPRLAIALSLTSLSLATLAQTDPRHAASVGTQRDARGNQSTLAEASTAVGETGWVGAGLGRDRSVSSAGTQHARVAKLSAGRYWDSAAGRWQAGVGVTQRGDGERLRQTDAQLSLGWQGDRFDAGAELSHRRARASDPTQGSERLSGPGLTLRGGARVGAARLYGAVSRTNYRSSVTQTVNSPTPGPLGGLIGARPTVVTRDSAALSRSAMLGASWQTGRSLLAAEWVQDRVLNQPDPLRTVQLKAQVDVASGWSLQPALGRSLRSGAQGGSNFAGLSVTRQW